MKKIIAIFSLFAIAGCEPTPDSIQRERPESISFKSNDRVKVERIGVFKDDLAYGDQRGIYIITDTKTNQEFVGVSGVGITEVGQHQVGKSQNTDER